MSKEEVASIGTRLKQVRTHLRIKQNTMADTLGISGAHLSEIENGKSSPSAEIFHKIGKIYNISLDYLFFEKGHMLYSSEPTTETYDFDHIITTVEKLAWMMNKSEYFKTLVLSAAQRAMIAEKDIIKKSMTFEK